MVKWHEYIIIGITLFVSGITAFMIFSEPYPCMETCIGCSSTWEYLHDSAPSLYMGISMIAGFILIFKGVGEKLG
jgi:hypothetical protein